MGLECIYDFHQRRLAWLAMLDRLPKAEIPKKEKPKESISTLKESKKAFGDKKPKSFWRKLKKK